MAVKTTKTKKRVRRSKPAGVSKRRAVLQASSLGIAPEYVLEIIPREQASVPAHLPPVLPPPLNLPGELALFNRPLVSSRTSFWLGVGFGMLVVGVLGALTWQFIKVEVVEAVVLGLTRS